MSTDLGIFDSNIPHENKIKSVGIKSAYPNAIVNFNNLPNNMKTMEINKKRKKKKITKFIFSRMP